VFVPEGVFLTGTVSLASNVYLTLDDGGILQGSANAADYSSDWDYWHVVQGVNASNTGVTGIGPLHTGAIAGPMWQMIASWDAQQLMYIPKTWFGTGGCSGECRPKDLAFIDANNVTIAGFQLVNSADWTLLLRRCVNVVVEDMYIRNSVAWPNGDGMDIESGSNITLRRLDIATGDDCIAMRSGNCNALRTPWPGLPGPLTGVHISDCVLRSTSAAIKIEGLFQTYHGNISDVTIANVSIYSSNRGIGLWQRIGPGSISNIRVTNVSSCCFLFASAMSSQILQRRRSASSLSFNKDPTGGAAASPFTSHRCPRVRRRRTLAWLASTT
jgi:polygalacturonase